MQNWRGRGAHLPFQQSVRIAAENPQSEWGDSSTGNCRINVASISFIMQATVAEINGDETSNYPE